MKLTVKQACALASRVENAIKPGPVCRDCADNDGRCPNTGELCNVHARAKEIADEVRKLIGSQARLLRAQERRVRELEGSYEEYPYWVGYRILTNCRGIKFYTFDRRTNRRISTSTVMCNPGMTLAERQEEITCAASCRNIDISFEEKAKQAKGDV